MWPSLFKHAVVGGFTPNDLLVGLVSVGVLTRIVRGEGPKAWSGEVASIESSVRQHHAWGCPLPQAW